MIRPPRLRRLAVFALTAPLVLGSVSAGLAACPIELATYVDADGKAELEFTPTRDAATVSNTFKVLLDNDVVLDGIVQWSQDVRRPYGMLMYKCPEGDVTGAELEQCTTWQGVIYASDETGKVDLLPAEAADAPRTLILADLGPSLFLSSAYGEKGFSGMPSDIFALKGCQE